MSSIFHSQSKGSRELLTVALLLAGAYSLYMMTFWHGWTYDDFPVIVNNPDVRSLADFLQDVRGGRPLRELTYLLDHQLFGLEPAGWRIQNIFWHGLNAWLVHLLVRRFGGTHLWAWCSAGVFLVHPLAVEVVAQTSHRKDSLALAAMLTALLVYRQAFSTGKMRPAYLLGAIVMGGIGYLAKQNAVAIFPVFLVYEHLFVAREHRFLLRYPRLVLAGGIISVVGFVLWLLLGGGAERYANAMQTLLLMKQNYLQTAEFSTYLMMLFKSWLIMAAKLFVPVHLALEYTWSVPLSWFDPWVLGGLLLVTGLLIVIWTFRDRSLLCFSLCWIVLTLLPTSNLWPLAYLAADRYLYAPSVGFVLLVGALFHFGWQRRPQVAGVGAVVVILLLVGLSLRQIPVWRSERALWTHALKVNPTSVVVLNNVGWAYVQEKQYENALALFHRATEINSYFARAWNNLAWVYEGRGDRQRAREYYIKALEVAPLLPGYGAQAQRIREHLRSNYGWRPTSGNEE